MTTMARLQCSFCNRRQDQDVRLLEANEIIICNHCVAFAYEVFDSEGGLPEQGDNPGFEDPTLLSTTTRAKPHEPDG